VFNVQLPNFVDRFLLNQLDGSEATIKVRANRILLIVFLREQLSANSAGDLEATGKIKTS
jgi:hypothetical protein